MRRFTLLFAVLAGCSHQVRSITTDAVLGRVVIYRNGVAFYERTARVVDGRVTVLVPRERVDDFLKSLTVVDPTTRKALAVSIPRQEVESGSYLTMSLETQGKSHGDVLLTYVTESPAWKPSYRVVIGANNKVMLEGWAIVDNVSSEDWKGVLVGVGASSALSFRYDLWSVRHVDRDLLHGDAAFAVAPPTGMSPYAQGEGEVVANLEGDEIRTGTPIGGTTSLQNTYVVEGVNTSGLVLGSGVTGFVSDTKSTTRLAGVTVIATSPSLPQPQTTITDENGYYAIGNLPPGRYMLTFYYGQATVERSNVAVTKDKATEISQKLDAEQFAREAIVISGAAPTIDVASARTGMTITKEYTKNIPVPGRTFESTLGAAAGSSSDGHGAPSPAPPPPIRQGDTKLKHAADRIIKDKKDVVVEAGGLTEQAARQRGEAVKNKLVDDGIPASRIHVRSQVGGDNRVRVLANAPTGPQPGAGAPQTAGGKYSSQRSV